MIALWSGAIVDIPTNHQLCDGTNGTPDLRDQFVVGAGSTYAVDASGGSTTHSHSLGTPPPGGIGAGADVDTITDSQSHLPPYYSLAYIQRIS